MAVAALCYLILTALLFRPLLPVITTYLAGDFGDPLLNASILAWNARHVPLTTNWWNYPAFAPLSGVTARLATSMASVSQGLPMGSRSSPSTAMISMSV